MTKFITEINKHTLGVVLIIVSALILGTIPAAIKEAITSARACKQV
jgi:competence protein ComGC